VKLPLVAASGSAALLASVPAFAAPIDANADALLSRPLALVVALALVSLLPFAFMALTSFLKISTVLQIAKSALGAQSIPSTSVIMALSAALSLLAMAPVGTRIGERLEPLLQDAELDSARFVTGVFEATAEPLRGFLSEHASPRETERFHLLARNARPTDQAVEVSRTDFQVVIPAFMVSELGEAFALGFAIFLPFLVIDLIVGNVLLALGMQMMSPTQVSLPFKLLLFVAADGWGLLAQALVTGYR
jgi:type III secretion protein R